MDDSVSFTRCVSEHGGVLYLWLEEETIEVTLNCAVESIQETEGGFVSIRCPDGYTLVEQPCWIDFIQKYATVQIEIVNWIGESAMAQLDDLLVPIGPYWYQ